MKKIYFVCKWNKEKEKTWSGTSFALYSELKKYFEVCDIEVTESILDKIRRYINGKLNWKCFREDFQIKLINQTSKRFRDVLNNSENTTFQFFETANNGSRNFIYQDLSVANILDLYENEKNIYKLTEFSNFSIQDIRTRLEMQKKFYNSCSGVFTMGEWLAEYLVKNNFVEENKVHAVGGGINIDKKEYHPLEKTRNKILFVGRNFERKGGCLVVEAFKKLRKEVIPDAELFIAGPTKNIWGDIEGVNFLGDLSRTELVKYYNTCDIFVMPSYFEAYGLVFGEALCFGLPCIARNKYAMPEFIKDGENGYLIDSDSYEELCEKMKLLLQNDTIFDNVKKERKNYIEKYSWENVVSKIYKYMEVVDAN